MRRAGKVSRTGQIRNEYKILIGKYEGNKPHGIRGERSEDNIKMDPREMGTRDSFPWG
jgi:hypothetical protein